MMPPAFWPFMTAASAFFVGLGALRLFLAIRPVTALLLILMYAPVLGWTWRRHYQGKGPA
jgi:hypothetical protein